MSQPTCDYGSHSQSNQRLGTTGLKSTNPSRKGDLAEQYITTLATQKGAEVFRNLNCTGPVDLILRVNGRLYEIDVKLARKRKDASGWRDDSARVKDPVYPLIVYPCGSDFSDWKVDWKGDRYPQELKDFWQYGTHTTG